MILEAQGIRIRPFERSDIPDKVRWINDPEVHRFLHYEIPLTEENTEKWLQRVELDESRRDLVIEGTGGQAIGLIGLMNIDRRHGSGEIYIVVGEKAYWGQGILGIAESLLIKWAFDSLGLYKIWATARKGNLGSILGARELGFEVEGTLRQEKVVAGERVDIVRLGLLKPEFVSAIEDE